MSRRLAAIRREDGVTMVLMVFIVALLGVLSLAMLNSVQAESGRSGTALIRDGSFQAAEAGINSYMSKLVDDTNFHSHFLAKGESTRRSTAGVVVAGSGTSNVAWTHPVGWTYPNGFDKWYAVGDGYEYSLQITPPSAGSSAIDIVAVGRKVGSTTNMRKLEALVRPAGVTDFQMLSAENISYGAPAVTRGKIYAGIDSNGNKKNVAHAGVAYADVYAEGDVTGAVTMMAGGKYDKDSNPTIRTKIANPINFASFMASLIDIQAASQAAGVYLSNSSVAAWWLKFSNNGTFTYQSCTQSGGSAVELVQPVCGAASAPVQVPANGAIYVAQTAIVSNATSNGGVKGRVTIASGNNLVVANNINPVTSGTDVLGLIGANEMIIAKWCPFNLAWTAATMSQNGMWRSAVNNPDTDAAGNYLHGTMTFTGSTATRGGTYYPSSGSPIVSGGFMTMFNTARNYQYDETLLYLQPPWFPTLGDSLTTLLFRELPAS